MWTEDQIREVGRTHYPFPYIGECDNPEVDCAGCPPWTGFDVEHIIKMLKTSGPP